MHVLLCFSDLISAANRWMQIAGHCRRPLGACGDSLERGGPETEHPLRDIRWRELGYKKKKGFSFLRAFELRGIKRAYSEWTERGVGRADVAKRRYEAFASWRSLYETWTALFWEMLVSEDFCAKVWVFFFHFFLFFAFRLIDRPLYPRAVCVLDELFITESTGLRRQTKQTENSPKFAPPTPQPKLHKIKQTKKWNEKKNKNEQVNKYKKLENIKKNIARDVPLRSLPWMLAACCT